MLRICIIGGKNFILCMSNKKLKKCKKTLDTGLIISYSMVTVCGKPAGGK